MKPNTFYILLFDSAAVKEVGLALAKNAIPVMMGSNIQPHLSLQLADGAVVRVYDQDHLTSSAVSPCSGKPPIFNIKYSM